MSLPKQAIEPVPEDTAQVAWKAFPTRFTGIADEPVF